MENMRLLRAHNGEVECSYLSTGISSASRVKIVIKILSPVENYLPYHSLVALDMHTNDTVKL